MSDPRAESNPFQPGKPLQEPDRFIGREHELLFIFQQIEKQQPTSVIGENRSGKTWLLRYLMNESIRQRYIPGEEAIIFLYADAASGLHSPEEFIQYILAGIQEKVPDLKLRARGSLQRQLYDCLDSMSPWRLVLILDDFESIAGDGGFPLDFYTFLRLIASDRDVSFIITTRQELFRCLPQQVTNSPFANIFTTMRMGPFAEDDLEAFIAWGEERSGMPMSQWRQTLEDITGRFPYLLQLACHHYFEVWLGHGGLDQQQEQVALERYATEAQAYLRIMWEGLGPEAQEIIRQTASGEAVSESRERERLELQGFLRKQRLFSPLFTDFVRTLAK